MQKIAQHAENRINAGDQINFPVKHAWLEVVLEYEFNSLDRRALDKDKLFNELNQEGWELFDNMMEWQNNAIRYSLPTD